MCTATNNKLLKELKKKENIIAYKLVRKCKFILYPKKSFISIFNLLKYNFDGKKLKWEKPFVENAGFSVILDEKEAIEAFDYLNTMFHGELQVYKVNCSNVVNAGIWNYHNVSSDNLKCFLDYIKVAEFKELEFIERIA